MHDLALPRGLGDSEELGYWRGMAHEQEPRLIAQTDEWWIVEKPARWLSVQGRSERPVVADWLRQRHGDTWIVHRLDEETSGVMLFARSEAAHRKACDWFSRHEVRKIYDFLAAGQPRLPVFRVDFPIEEKPSSTQVEVEERYRSSEFSAFLGRARPVTGRRHQIRIHLSRSGHPLWGDSRYEGTATPAPGFGVSRVALHARSLSLPSGETYESPWPQDFSNWVEQARRFSRGTS